MIDEAKIQMAAAHLLRGGLVVMPTETVYGLAADARNAAAVTRIFQAKGRPTFDPLIVHVADRDAAWDYGQPNDHALALAQAFWPGPLTLVLPRNPLMVPDIVTSGMETVGLRCPDHPLALRLLKESGLAVAAPSANMFGRISPTAIEHVGNQFDDFDALLLDGGACRVGVESTVVACLDQPTILRPGGVTSEQISAVCGCDVTIADTHGRAQHLPAPAPGMLASHYAPGKQLILREQGMPWPTGNEWGYCAFTGDDLPSDACHVEVLSDVADLAKAATGLFAALRRLDASSATRLCAELMPQRGLGIAINDRLMRAAGRG